MVQEKAIYWLSVGVLGLGLCNSLPRKLDSATKLFERSNQVTRTIASSLSALTGHNASPEIVAESACARTQANAAIAQMNLDMLKVRNEEIRARISAARDSREKAFKVRRSMVIAVSGSSVKLTSNSM